VRRVIVPLAVLTLLPAPAFAHQGAHHGLPWSWDPEVLALLAIAGAWYGLGLLTLSQRHRRHHVVSGTRIAFLLAGLATLFLALESPLDALSDQLFSAHMTQHLVLILVAPPLFILSRSTPVLLWAMPADVRRATLSSWRQGWLGAVGRILFNPLLVWIAFGGGFIFWHIPGPYRWAVEERAVHALEHLWFFLSSLAFWTIVLERGVRRLDYASTLLFLVGTAILSGLPGALLLFAARPFYGAGAAAAHWGLTPLEDQQLAGVIMWVPMGFAYVAAGVWVFVRWMEAMDRKRPTRLRASPALPILLFAVMLPLLLGLGEGPAAAAEPSSTRGGDADRGAQLIGKYGCGYCHTIPGIANAKGRVGPPLTDFGDRLYVAGMLPNTRDNLMAWIEDPQRIVPGNVMPVLGVTEDEARDIAAYLHSLH
jgi:cytochrome c oxidase assembly factor CtaG/cytochrome c2